MSHQMSGTASGTRSDGNVHVARWRGDTSASGHHVHYGLALQEGLTKYVAHYPILSSICAVMGGFFLATTPPESGKTGYLAAACCSKFTLQLEGLRFTMRLGDPQ